ncbi:hypothetical protein I317_01721 [Kwoniella heveanensis CBS 569]|nr:hypothetical protein I317_01721 [Kwoniella heveanensis CBS 569]
MFRHIRNALPRRFSGESSEPQRPPYQAQARRTRPGYLDPSSLESFLDPDKANSHDNNDSGGSHKIPADSTGSSAADHVATHSDGSQPPFELSAETTTTTTTYPNASTCPTSTNVTAGSTDTVTFEPFIPELESIPSSRLIELDSSSESHSSPDTLLSRGTATNIRELDSTPAHSSPISFGPSKSIHIYELDPGVYPTSPPLTSRFGQQKGQQQDSRSPTTTTASSSSPSRSKSLPTPTQSQLSTTSYTTATTSAAPRRSSKSTSPPPSTSASHARSKLDESSSPLPSSPSSPPSPALSTAISIQLTIPFQLSPQGSSSDSSSPPGSPRVYNDHRDRRRRRQGRGRGQTRRDSIITLLSTVISTISELLIPHSRNRSHSQTQSRGRTFNHDRGRRRRRSSS